MLFSRVATFLALIFTLGILAAAKPVELENRANNAAVQQAITTLQSKTNTILPQIKSAGASQGASAATVAPLINELVSAINAAQASVAESSLQKRQSSAEIASAVAVIISDIALTLEGLKFVGLPGLIASVDFALFELLKGLDVVIIGLGLVVGGLLKDVGKILIGLGFGLSLGLLGL